MKIGDYEIQVPFVTTSSDHIKTILELADLQPGQKVTDLGSGDGRMVIEFAKHGAIVHGYEIKEPLVIKSRNKIEDAKLQQYAFIHQYSYWEKGLSSFDLVYIYGMQSIMGKLEQKLEKELKPGAKFISNIFHLPHWKPKKVKKNIYLYIK